MDSPEKNPAAFEHLRQYLDDAVNQLLVDMKDQAIAYAVPTNDIVELVKAVAERLNQHPLMVWQSWDLRHQIPIERFSARANNVVPLADFEVKALRKRLRDRLGYTILGLVLTEKL